MLIMLINYIDNIDFFLLIFLKNFIQNIRDKYVL